LKTTEHVTSATGDDILFRALDDATCGGVGMAPCTLDHEIETYNGTTGELVVWVRIPSLSATSDTTLYIYYGNSDITAPIENPTGVWISDFALVQHFRDDPTGSPPQMLDSTTHHIDGTTNGGVAATTGQIDGALFFDGNNDYVDIDPITPHSYGDFTISVWYRSTSSTVSDDQYIFVHGHPTWFDDDSVTFGPTDDSSHQDRLRFLLTRSEEEFYYYGTSDIVDQQWHHLVAVRGGGRVRLYVDGVEEIDVADLDPGNTVVINDIASRAFIGDNPGNTEQVDGYLDEVRLFDDDRSGDWVLTTYNNQKWPNKTDFPTNGFLTVGVEESTPPTAVTLLCLAATGHQGGVLLHWRTGYDIDNLGWHVYREVNGERVRLTPELIAGSALMFGPSIQLHAGN
jgi:MSHA biogenesis protein MshQ